MDHLPDARRSDLPDELNRSVIMQGAEADTPFIISWWQRVRRHPWIILMATATGASAVIVFLSITPPRYTAEATLGIDARKTQWTSMPSPVPEPPSDRAMVLALTWAEVERLSSWTMALQVADALGLAHDPEFDVTNRPWTKRTVDWWRDNVEPTVGSFLGKQRRAPYAPQADAIDPATRIALDPRRIELAQAVGRGLKVDADRNTGLISLKYVATDPTKAALIASKWVELYVDDELARKRQQIEGAIGWLDGHLADLQQKVGASDAAVQAYKADMRLMVVTDKGATLAAQQASAIGESITQATAELAGIEARIQAVKAARRDANLLSHSPDAMESKVIQDMRVDGGRQLADLNDKEMKYGPKHPAILAAKATIRANDQAIAAELNRIAGSLETARASHRAKIASLRSGYTGAQDSLRDQTMAEGRLRQLEADANANRGIYNSFLLHRRELMTQFNVQKPDATVLSPPSAPPSQSSPNRTLLMAVGTMFGALVGCALALLIEAATSGFRNLEQLERRLRLRAVGIVPSVGRRHREGDGWNYDRGAFIEMLHGIRAGLGGSQRRMPRSLLVTSALPGEGKSVTAMALARVSAVCDGSTLLIDGDLARPNVHRQIGRPNRAGLADILEGHATLDQVMIKDPTSGARILLAGVPSRHPAELLASNRMQQLLVEAKKRFQVVIIDSAPLLTVADTGLMAGLVDRTLLVVRWRRTSRNAVAAAIRLLKDVESPEPVCALTRVNMEKFVRYDARDLRQCAGYARQVRAA